ncbi:hypothetical protein F2Q69_00027299 [Brassica cretica]|uniref:Uncharacterized protein n=1 Tax=Brassica cretica TaxID=69181 RepID=A0A8S9S5F6_BRACR|nr:hypothetical protein F2Q69_00027299 [Brassica cretica]
MDLTEPIKIPGCVPITGKDLSDPLVPTGRMSANSNRSIAIRILGPNKGKRLTGSFMGSTGSNLESIVNGVPLIAWPLYAEQKTNASLLVEDVRVARNNEYMIARKEEVVRVIMRLMEGEEGNVIRNQMKELKERAVRVLREDGLSTKAFTEVSLKWKSH